MIREVTMTQKWFKTHFGENPKPGIYMIPTQTSRGPAYMQVLLNAKKGLSGFELFWDEAGTISWYNFNKDGSPRY